MAKERAVSGPDNGHWPAGDLENVSHCPVCGSGRRQRAYAGLTDQIFNCAPGEWDLYRCEGCGSAYLDPRPTPASIGQAYANYYTHTPTDGAKPDADSWWRQWRISQRNGFLNKHFGYDFFDDTDFFFFFNLWIYFGF
jgi:hypothetical protein